MKLAEVSSELFARAIEIYATEAYGDNWPKAVRKAHSISGRTFRHILPQLVDESSHDHRRYILRLGNPNYPCMKLVFEELLYDGEFFFLVDTHDDLDLDTSFPGYDDWQELRKYNRELKNRIERRWATSGLPTIEVVRDIAADEARHHTAAPLGLKVLLALDDPTEAEAVSLALRSHGYDVASSDDPDRLFHDVDRERPDLVLVGHLLGGRSGRRIANMLSERRSGDAGKYRLVLGLPRWDLRDKPTDVDAVVPEPFDRNRLLRALDELLVGKRA